MLILAKWMSSVRPTSLAHASLASCSPTSEQRVELTGKSPSKVKAFAWHGRLMLLSGSREGVCRVANGNINSSIDTTERSRFVPITSPITNHTHLKHAWHLMVSPALEIGTLQPSRSKALASLPARSLGPLKKSLGRSSELQYSSQLQSTLHRLSDSLALQQMLCGVSFHDISASQAGGLRPTLLVAAAVMY